MKKPLDIGETLQLAWTTFSNNAVPLIVGMLLVTVVGMVTLGIAIGPLMLGYCKMSLRAARGEQVAIGDVFEGFQRFVPGFVLFLLMGIAIGIGFVLLVLPGLVLGALFFFAPWVMAADENVGPIDALKASVAIVTRDPGGAIVFILVNMVVASAGSVVGFGTLLTGPIASAMTAHGYIRLPESGEARSPGIA